MPVEITEIMQTASQTAASQTAASPKFQPSTKFSALQAPKPPPPPGRGIYVATPCYGCLLNIGYLQSLLALQTACLQRGVSCFVDFIGNESLVQRARNILAARFLQSTAGSTHLLFIDADIAFDPATVFRLLDFDKDVVTAIYPKKNLDWAGVEDAIAKGRPNPRSSGLDFNINIAGSKVDVTGGFAKVLDSATGFMMIKRAALNAVADRYKDTLNCVNDIQGGGDNRVERYVAVFDCMIDPDSRRYLSEDYAFCRRWQQMGGEIWADVATPLCHIGNYPYDGDIRQRQTITFAD